ncbi:flavin reductase family protein [Nordella sp. HKS 07]|uniref:flavin reductase family protein n=1 Tax=Nordella sp. HKS 07 TaxID=2712222 RepID=UPI0013E12BE2|nr:flavin reductase family protein [Nordella sp. HKS 07]QIG51582.1 flavin reductase family protein [Nordella sp. HKS 07]
MHYDAIDNKHGLPNDPFKAIVAPRPIGWVSSMAKSGVPNLAPYSFFNAIAEQPHYVVIGSGGMKDSLTNIEATGEFVINLATYDLREPMNMSSARVGPDVDEFKLAGLTPEPSRFVKPPRVKESPAALECRLFQIVPLPDNHGDAHQYAIIGRVVGVYIDDRFIHDGRVDTAAMRPIARMGYSEYATVEQAWRMRRPD